jgi:hypothetical protein
MKTLSESSKPPLRPLYHIIQRLAVPPALAAGECQIAEI